MVSKEKYQECKEKGICLRCGKKIEDNNPHSTLCWDHYQKQVEYRSNHYNKCIDEVRCVKCGKPNDRPSFTACSVCDLKHRTYMKKLRDNRKKESKCVDCGIPIYDGATITRCVTCAERNSKSSQFSKLLHV